MSQSLQAPCRTKLGSMIRSTLGSALACGVEVVLVALIDESSPYSDRDTYFKDIATLRNARQRELGTPFTKISLLLLHVTDRTGEHSDIFPPSIVLPDWVHYHQVGRPVSLEEYEDILGELVETAGYVSFAVDNSGSMSTGTLQPYLDTYADALRALPSLSAESVVIRNAGDSERWAIWLTESIAESVEFIRTS